MGQGYRYIISLFACFVKAWEEGGLATILWLPLRIGAQLHVLRLWHRGHGPWGGVAVSTNHVLSRNTMVADAGLGIYCKINA
jgi:hypothetical protein